MPIATPEVYAEMLDRAKDGAFAYPAINVTSSQTLNAALRGFAEAESDGIVQVSTGGAEYLSGPDGQGHGDRRRWRSRSSRTTSPRAYPVTIALHTDHCPKDKLDGFMRPLIEISQERVAAGGSRCSSRTCGTARRSAGGEPQDRRASCSSSAPRRRSCMEIEIGVVGGEEDGVDDEINDKLYTTPDDALRTVEALGARREGPLPAGGDVRQRARRLQAGQRQAARRRSSRRSRTRSARSSASEKPFDLVFHGGSGSLLEEIRETLDYGVVKMNVDTDTQYAFTRPIADHMFTQLRRRAQDRRRGRQQEGLRPARLRQGRPRPAWPPASSRPARTCAPPAPRSASSQAGRSQASARRPATRRGRHCSSQGANSAAGIGRPIQ